jgi:hypothetical protein
MRQRILFAVAAFAIASFVIIPRTLSSAAPASPSSDAEILKAFAEVHPIDTHVHIFKSDAALQGMLQESNLKLLNILVMDDTLSYRKDLQTQVNDALALVKSSQGHIVLCTTFDPYKFDDPNFTANAIKQLNHDFAEGAVAVKIWKNIGMEIKDQNGKYIFADDPKFAPIYKDIADHGKTLLTHQAEPDVAWGPPDPKDPSWSY